MESSDNEKSSEENMKAKENVLRSCTFVGAPVGVWLIMALVAIAAISFITETWDDMGIRSIDDAVTFLSVSSQVNATFAGFLLVGLIFLVRERAFSFKKKWWYVEFLDISLLGSAMILLVITAFEGLISIPETTRELEVTPEILDNLAATVLFIKLSYILVLMGLMAAVISFKARSDSERERTEDRELSVKPKE